ncbi:MAG: SpoIIE family protein phosphatase [Chloroflexota bacterium]|nr:SpoIIE family protein phosphatase [Chloroflexota bacterium]
MKSEERTLKPTGYQLTPGRVKKGLGLQTRMAISYVGTSLVIVLLLELLVGGLLFFVLARSPFLDDVILHAAKQTAQVYALQAALQAGDTALDPRATFQPGQPSSFTAPDDLFAKIPYLSESVPYIGAGTRSVRTVSFALLIAPNGRVLASSYPARYPVSASVARLLPGEAGLIFGALAGRTASVVQDTTQERVASAADTVWSRTKRPLGVLYVQVLWTTSNDQILSDFGWGWLRSGMPWLLIMAPIGGIFGVVTTRGLVRRIHRLAKTTTQFAAGQYEQRIPVVRKDEVGQLEQSFNQMAEQLVESMAQRQILIEQQARLEERARIEQEMHTARNIQQALLPKDVPDLPGWHIATYYQPSREVGGDFYDFLPFDDDRLGIIIGDATDKGMPAALVMATTCTMLRTAALDTLSPGDVLARVNELLYMRIPARMFVTCFYAILDPRNGSLRYANAGHEWPYRRHNGSVSELQATGMPLGMMPGSCYDEQEVILAPGESVLLYSDGLVEAHNTRRDMFGLPQIAALAGTQPGGTALIDDLLSALTAFTGKGWEQEDDVTLVTLHRAPETSTMNEQQEHLDLLVETRLASVPGNEQQALKLVAEAVDPLHLSAERLDNLKTAVAEAVMNAMEHGNGYQPDKVVVVQVLASDASIVVRVRDQGEGRPIPEAVVAPDLDAQLAGLQRPRGWGFFLIKNLVDELSVTNDEHSHTIELIMHRGAENAGDRKI